MLVTRVNAHYLRPKRVDPDYYRPEFLDDERRLLARKHRQLGQLGRFFVGPFGSLLPSNIYLSSGVPLFRVGNVGSMEVLMDDMAHLDPAVHDELRASEVLPGDLLIVKASVGEKICKVPHWIPRANITQHIIAVRPNDSADIDYVAAFLFGTYGRRQLDRRSLGSIIQYLGVIDARDILCPDVAREAQAYIGDKVRQAEHLRERARRLEGEAGNLCHIPQIDAALLVSPEKTSRVGLADMRHRLDSKYYGARAIAVEKACWACGARSLLSLGPNVSNGFEHREFCANGRRYITVSEVSSGRLVADDAPCISRDVEVPSKACLSSRCVLVVRTGSIGLAVKVHEEDVDACISSHLIRLEFCDEALAAAVGAFLSTSVGDVLLRKISYGGVQPQVGQEEVMALPVPESICGLGDVFLGLHNAREGCLRGSRRLTVSAKSLVEALIDGKVSESDLVEAQKALEAGNRDPDRALLSRLTPKGIDVTGEQPLFPDLDKLYELLDETEGEVSRGPAYARASAERAAESTEKEL